MDAQSWVYDRKAHRFRNAETGRWLPNATVANLREELLAALAGGADTLAERLADGTLDLNRWLRAMRDLTDAAYGTELVFGKGGFRNTTDGDWQSLTAPLVEQYRYLRAFAAQIADEGMSLAQVKNRASMYVESARQAYWRGTAAARDVALPCYPGTGTPCGPRCRCEWSYRDDGMYWVASADACEGCAERARLYNPFPYPEREAA